MWKSREMQPGPTRRRNRWWLFFLAVRKDEAEDSLRRREEEDEGGQMSARQSVRTKKTSSATATNGKKAAQSRSPTVSELPDLTSPEPEEKRESMAAYATTRSAASSTCSLNGSPA